MKKPNATTGVLLCAALIFTPPALQVRAEKSDEKVWEYVMVGALVIGVGTFVVIGLKSMASRIPPVTPPPAPPTNPPPVMNPTNAPPTNTITKPWYKRIFSLDGSTFPQQAITLNHIPDGNVGAKTFVYYDTLIAFKLQSTTDLRNWTTEMSVTNWVSASGMFSAYYRDGVNVTNTYTSGHIFTNFIPLDIGSGDEPSKFFRIAP